MVATLATEAPTVESFALTRLSDFSQNICSNNRLGPQGQLSRPTTGISRAIDGPQSRLGNEVDLVANWCRTDVKLMLASRSGPPSCRKFVFRFGSGAGIRTLNLAVNRSLRPVQKWRFVFAECR